MKFSPLDKKSNSYFYPIALDDHFQEGLSCAEINNKYT